MEHSVFLYVLFFYSTNFVQDVLSNSFNFFTDELIGVSNDTGSKESISYFVNKKGYELEEHYIDTEDGYILTYHRVKQWWVPNTGVFRDPVLLQHGLATSSAVFLTPDRNALAYVLADAGFDVWLANSRGNKYSRRHKRLEPDSQSEFWQFSVHEMGVYDLSAAVDYITRVTKKRSLRYVGHSHGATLALVLVSTRPHYQDRLEAIVALAPTVYLGTVSPQAQAFINTTNEMATVYEKSGKFEALTGMDSFLKGFCEIRTDCKQLFKDIQGTTTEISWTEVLKFQPSGTSTTAIHYVSQQMNNGYKLSPGVKCWKNQNQNIVYFQKKYRKFKYTENNPYGNSTHMGIKPVRGHESISEDRIGITGQEFKQHDHGIEKNKQLYELETAPYYNFSRISTPIAIFYSQDDLIISSQNILQLKAKLRNATLHPVNETQFNHFDFLWGRNSKILIYNTIITLFKPQNNLETRSLRLRTKLKSKRFNGEISLSLCHTKSKSKSLESRSTSRLFHNKVKRSSSQQSGSSSSFHNSKYESGQTYNSQVKYPVFGIPGTPVASALYYPSAVEVLNTGHSQESSSNNHQSELQRNRQNENNYFRDSNDIGTSRFGLIQRDNYLGNGENKNSWRIDSQAQHSNYDPNRKDHSKTNSIPNNEDYQSYDGKYSKTNSQKQTKANSKSGKNKNVIVRHSQNFRKHLEDLFNIKGIETYQQASNGQKNIYGFSTNSSSNTNRLTSELTQVDYEKETYNLLNKNLKNNSQLINTNNQEGYSLWGGNDVSLIKSNNKINAQHSESSHSGGTVQYPESKQVTGTNGFSSNTHVNGRYDNSMLTTTHDLNGIINNIQYPGGHILGGNPSSTVQYPESKQVTGNNGFSSNTHVNGRYDNSMLTTTHHVNGTISDIRYPRGPVLGYNPSSTVQYPENKPVTGTNGFSSNTHVNGRYDSSMLTTTHHANGIVSDIHYPGGPIGGGNPSSTVQYPESKPVTGTDGFSSNTHVKSRYDNGMFTTTHHANGIVSDIHYPGGNIGGDNPSSTVQYPENKPVTGTNGFSSNTHVNGRYDNSMLTTTHHVNGTISDIRYPRGPVLGDNPSSTVQYPENKPVTGTNGFSSNTHVNGRYDSSMLTTTHHANGIVSDIHYPGGPIEGGNPSSTVQYPESKPVTGTDGFSSNTHVNSRYDNGIFTTTHHANEIVSDIRYPGGSILGGNPSSTVQYPESKPVTGTNGFSSNTHVNGRYNSSMFTTTHHANEIASDIRYPGGSILGGNPSSTVQYPESKQVKGTNGFSSNTHVNGRYDSSMLTTTHHANGTISDIRYPGGSILGGNPSSTVQYPESKQVTGTSGFSSNTHVNGRYNRSMFTTTHHANEIASDIRYPGGSILGGKPSSTVQYPESKPVTGTNGFSSNTHVNGRYDSSMFTTTHHANEIASDIRYPGGSILGGNPSSTVQYPESKPMTGTNGFSSNTHVNGRYNSSMLTTTHHANEIASDIRYPGGSFLGGNHSSTVQYPESKQVKGTNGFSSNTHVNGRYNSSMFTTTHHANEIASDIRYPGGSILGGNPSSTVQYPESKPVTGTDGFSSNTLVNGIYDSSMLTTTHHANGTISDIRYAGGPIGGGNPSSTVQYPEIKQVTGTDGFSSNTHVNGRYDSSMLTTTHHVNGTISDIRYPGGPIGGGNPSSTVQYPESKPVTLTNGYSPKTHVNDFSNGTYTLSKSVNEKNLFENASRLFLKESAVLSSLLNKTENTVLTQNDYTSAIKDLKTIQTSLQSSQPLLSQESNDSNFNTITKIINNINSSQAKCTGECRRVRDLLKNVRRFRSHLNQTYFEG